MKELPQNQLCPKIKNVWRINDFIWLTITFIFLAAIFVIIYVVEEAPGCLWALSITGAVYFVCLGIFVIMIPAIRFKRWRYELSNEFIDIARGIIWRKRFIIPFIRVQNTDTRQGPIMRAFKLASVTISTAAGEHTIPGLSEEIAEQLRDKAAELARIAQEDV